LSFDPAPVAFHPESGDTDLVMMTSLGKFEHVQAITELVSAHGFA
jgi:hypothetical protein